METENVDLRELTAPCGLDCFNCVFYLANDNDAARKQVESFTQQFGFTLDKALCKGCRARGGVPPVRVESCNVFKCISSKGIEFCSDCSDFPCDNLHPYADMATMVPHNMKVFNLCLIRKMGVEKWAKDKAKLVRDTYFSGKWNI